MITITTPEGNEVSLGTWANRNGVNKTTVWRRYRQGERDIWKLVRPAQKRGRPKNVDLSDGIPIISESKREELLKLAKYSMGQKDQKKILCDLLPCERKYGDWLMKELGLNE